MKYQLRIAVAVSCLLFAACGGQTGGFAPATLPLATHTDISEQSNLKFGESNTSASNWEVSLDTTDPVEEILLANGWNVEVRFE